MKKDIYKGKINKQGVELAPDWTEMGLNPITGTGDGANNNKNYYDENRKKYMKRYYQVKKEMGLV